MKITSAYALICAVVLATASCSDAWVASDNLSTAADNFEINRRVVFYNGITGEYMLVIEGLCSLGKAKTMEAITVTCKTGEKQYKKHFLGLSDNVTFIAEQLADVSVSKSHYRVVFKPSVILPDIELRP